MTQQDLADRLSVLKGAVSAWETGKAFPSASRARAIQRLFGAYDERQLDQAAEESVSYSARPASILIRLTPEELRIVGIYRWLVRQSEEGTA